MKYYVKTILPLVVLAVFFGTALGTTYFFLSPKILETQKKEEAAALTKSLKAGKSFEKITNANRTLYKAYNEDKNLVGYVFKENKGGYGGPIVTLVGVSTNGAVDSIVITSADQETPGLGYKCMERKWQDQFSGVTVDRLPKDKAGFAATGIDVITGATITSMAVVKNINNALSLYEKIHIAEMGGDNE